MKKEKSFVTSLLRDAALYAAGIIVASVSIIGILCGASVIVDFLSGLMTVEIGLPILFTVAGAALYIDFRPEKKKAHTKRRNDSKRPVTGSVKAGRGVNPTSVRMLSVYSAK